MYYGKNLIQWDMNNYYNDDNLIFIIRFNDYQL